MRQVGIFEAKTHLSELLAEVEKGMTLTITRRGQAIAVLSPITDKPTQRQAATAALAEIRRSQKQAVTADDILSWKEEGRRL